MNVNLVLGAILLVCALRSGTALTLTYPHVDSHLPHSHGRSLPSNAMIPLPSPAQLKWSQQEIGVLIHFNMGTYLYNSTSGGDGIDGCVDSLLDIPPVSTFAPYLLNTDQWAQAIQALGAKYAVLVGKHNCGFTTWPTQANFPASNFTYTYSIQYSSVPNMDVIASFVKSMNKAGLGSGYYYSVVVNNWLNVCCGGLVQPNPSPTQVSITQELYEDIVVAQLTELWDTYGQQGLSEIWFDGGYSSALAPRIQQLLAKFQPHAPVFNGYPSFPNPIRWIGTESGQAPSDTWSTGTTQDGGDPNSPVWNPAECDTTIQQHDHWFYKGPDYPLRSLAEMIAVYHSTVGHNCQLMLDVSPDNHGLVPDNHVKLYTQLGQFIKQCYGSPVAWTSGSGTEFVLKFDTPTTIDRVVLQEDQAQGQVVRSWSVSVLVAGGSLVPVSSGSSIGNKRISLFTAPMLVSSVVLRISSSAGAITPTIRNFAAHYCAHINTHYTQTQTQTTTTTGVEQLPQAYSP